MPAGGRTRAALALSRLAQAEPPPYSPQVLRGSDPGLPASFGQAMLAYTEGNYQLAAEGLRTAAQVDPARPDIAFFLAASELLAGNPAAARAGFEAVLALGDTVFTDEAHFYLAKAQLALGDPDAARLSLQRVSRSDAALHGEAASLQQQLDSLPAS
jgi:tetratricopeptide (TPR) repeat protein